MNFNIIITINTDDVLYVGDTVVSHRMLNVVHYVKEITTLI